MVYLSNSVAYKLQGKSEPADKFLTDALNLAKTLYKMDEHDWDASFRMALYHLALCDDEVAEAIYLNGVSLAPSFDDIYRAARDLREWINETDDQIAEKIYQFVEEALQLRMAKQDNRS